jgi:hypothetical protein
MQLFFFIGQGNFISSSREALDYFSEFDTRGLSGRGTDEGMDLGMGIIFGIMDTILGNNLNLAYEGIAIYLVFFKAHL